MNFIEEFIKKESSSGILLIIATAMALLLKNSFFSEYYVAFLQTPVEVRFADLHIAKPLLLWINDGLMAVFFLLIGLEVKREFLEGQLSTPGQIALPGIAAIGGMVVPACFYIFINHGNETAMRGWAIPTATDIAFALGVLALLGNRVPLSLKVFLMALAIIDDLGAIVIIALFYTVELSTLSITIAAIALS
ncbi:MAG TPA: Na+/H+ antiporter NhaA, partial [Thiotrichales bacterium]|nr:Na+/H+ antiporter NhaA [Thiotrichales bacterium]